MNLQALRGVIPAIVTPFDTDGGVDLPATATLTRWLVDSGVHAIMTTGGDARHCCSARMRLPSAPTP